MPKYRKHEAKEYARANVKGLWIGATTPFTEDREVDWAALRGNYRFFFDKLQLVGGIFSPTVIGESWSLTTDERKQALELLVNEARGKVMVMAYVMSGSIKEIVQLCHHAEEVGADFVSFTQPFIGATDGDPKRVYKWFADVAKQINLGMCVFNLPATGHSISPQLLGELAKLENVALIKDPETVEHVAASRKAAGKNAIVCDCIEDHWLDDVLAGNPAMVANGMPYLYQIPEWQPLAEYTQLTKSGKTEEAKKVSESMQPTRDLLKKWNERGKQWGTPGSVYKAWIDAMGTELKGGYVRMPLLDMPSEEKAAMAEDLRRVGLVSQVASRA